jgi:ankyrin repeat protein
MVYIKKIMISLNRICNAILHGNIDIVLQYIINGGDLNAKTDKGLTLLHLACKHNMNFIALSLIQFGANCQILDDNNCLPLHYTMNPFHRNIISKNTYLLIDQLIKHGGLVPQYINDIFKLALKYKNLEAIKLLIAEEITINFNEYEEYIKELQDYTRQHWTFCPDDDRFNNEQDKSGTYIREFGNNFCKLRKEYMDTPKLIARNIKSQYCYDVTYILNKISNISEISNIFDISMINKYLIDWAHECYLNENIQNTELYTHSCICQNNIKIIEDLIREIILDNCQINRQDDQTLYCEINDENIDNLQKLLECRPNHYSHVYLPDIIFNAICLAVKKNNINILELLLTYNRSNLNLNQNKLYIKQVNPLLLSVLRNKYEYIIMLIRAGADMNFVTLDNCTVLAHAAREEDENMCKFLIENGADIKLAKSNLESMKSNYINNTPLDVIKGLNIINKLLKMNLSKEELLLCEIKDKSSVDIIRDIITSNEISDENIFRAICLSAYIGDEQVLRLLLSRNINLNRNILPNTNYSSYKCNPLFCAALDLKLERVKLLLDAGVDINYKLKNKTVLLSTIKAATYNEHYKNVAKFLIRHGANYELTKRLLNEQINRINIKYNNVRLREKKKIKIEKIRNSLKILRIINTEIRKEKSDKCCIIQ